MTNAKHTPGPWKLCGNEQQSNFQIIGADSLPVCVMSHVKSSSLANWGNKKVSPKMLWTTTANEVEQSNARLIAAAPELLAALEELSAAATALESEYCKQWGENGFTFAAHNAGAKARAAIAKAKGEQS